MEKGGDLIADSFPQTTISARAELGQAEARSPDFKSGLPGGWQGTQELELLPGNSKGAN